MEANRDDGASFAELLATARAEAGLTQEELAERAQLSARAVSSLERGEVARPRRATVDRLVAGLGLTGVDATRFAALARGRRLGGDGPGPAQLPTDLPDFTGRTSELARLIGLLARGPEARPRVEGVATAGDADRTGVRIVALGGGGGVGKTALAVRAAHLLRDRYPDGQLYLDLAGSRADPVEPADALAGFLTALGAEPGEREQLVARYRSVVSGLRVLVVLDDALDAAQVRPLLPTGPGSATVVTSRSGLADLAGAAHLEVGELDEREAVELFVRLVGADRVAAEPDAVAAVVAACERLPLAVRIAGARLAVRPEWTIGALADRLAESRRRLDELRAGDLAVRASFRLSYDRLPAGPAELFALLAHWPGHDIAVPAAAALADVPDAVAEERLEELVDRHLLESPAPGRYRQHDLLHAFAGELLAAEVAPARSAAALRRLVRYVTGRAYRADLVLWPTTEPPFPIDEVPDGPEFPDYGAALDWYTERWSALLALLRRAAAGDAVPAGELARLGTLLDMYPFVRGDHELLERCTRQTVELAERAGDDLLAGTAHKRLGIALLDRHRPAEAARHHELARSRFRAAGAADAEASLLNSIGRRLMHEHEYPAARRYLLDSVAAAEASGRDSTRISALSNLGLLEHRAGDDTAALDYLTRARALCGTTSSQVAAAVASNLGSVLASLGRPADAVREHQRAVAIAREQGDRHAEASVLIELADTYLVLGRADRAVRCARQALALRQAEQASRPLQATARVTLGRALHALGHASEARNHWRWALTVLADTDPAAADAVRALLNG